MKDKTFSRRHRNLIFLGLGCLGLAALFYWLACQGIGIPCLFRRVTGLSCPGCGNSRAALRLLELDIAGGLRYNLLFPLEFFYLAWVIGHCCKSYLQGRGFSYRPPWSWLDGGILVLVVLWWVARNVLGI